MINAVVGSLGDDHAVAHTEERNSSGGEYYTFSLREGFT